MSRKGLMGAFFSIIRCFFCRPVEKQRKVKKGLLRAIIRIIRCFIYGRVEKLRKIKKDLMDAIITLIRCFVCRPVAKLRKIKKDLTGVIISAIRWFICRLLKLPRKIKKDEFSLERIYPEESKEIENVEEREEEVLKIIEAGEDINFEEQIEKNQEACLLPELHSKEPTEKKQGICLDTFRNSIAIDILHDQNDKEFEEPNGKKQHARWVKKVNSEKCIENVGAKGQEVIMSVVAEEERGSNMGRDSVLIPPTRWVEKVRSEKCIENVGAKGQEVIMGVVAEEERGSNIGHDSVLISQTRWVEKVHSEKCVENVGAKGQEVIKGVVAEEDRGSNGSRDSVLIPQTRWVEKVHSEKYVENVGANGQKVIMGVASEEERGSNRGNDSVLIPQTRWVEKVHSENCVENVGAIGQEVITVVVEEEERGSNRCRDSVLIPQTCWVEKVDSEKCVENVGAKGHEVIMGVAAEEGRRSNRGHNSVLIPQTRWVEKVHSEKCIENVGAKGQEVIMGVVAEVERGSNRCCGSVLIPHTCLDSFQNSTSTDTSHDLNEIKFPKFQDCMSNLSTASADILHDQNDIRSEEFQDYQSNSSTSILHDQNDIKFEECQDFERNLSTSGSQELEVVHFHCTDYPCYSTRLGFGGDDPFICNPSKTYKCRDKIASTKRKGKKKNSEPIAKKQNARWVEKVHYKECFENVGMKGQEVIVGVVAKDETGSNRGRDSVKIPCTCLDSFKNTTSTDTSYDQNEIESPEYQDCTSNLSTISAGISHDQNDTRSEECQDYQSVSSTSILHNQNYIKFGEFQDYQSNSSTSGSQEREVFISAASSPYSEDPNLHGTFLQDLEVSDVHTSVDSTKFMEEKKKDACLLEEQHNNKPNEKKQEGCLLFQEHSEEPTGKKQDVHNLFIGTIKIKGVCLLEESLENQHGACLREEFHSKEPIENVEGEQVDTKGLVAKERWINHYSSLQNILLVGEGDFSFAASLAKAFCSASHMIATSLDSKEFLRDQYGSALTNIKNLTSWGCRVLHGIDATKMANNQLLKCKKFDRIIFNFPFAGFFKNELRYLQLWRHQHLVSLFLENAKEMINVTGEIHITHKTNGFHSEWNIEELASCHGLRLIEAVNFNCSDYPGYNTKCGFGGDNNFDCNPSKTYKFGLNNAKNAADKKKKTKEKDLRLQADLSWSFNRTMMEYTHVLPPYLDCAPSGVFQPMASPPYLDSPLSVFQPMASSPYLDCSPLGIFQPMDSQPYLDYSPLGAFEPVASFAGVSQPIAPFSDVINADHPYSSNWSL